MPEARHSMLLSDARQTSPLPANALLLPQQSVSTSNLDLRQVVKRKTAASKWRRAMAMPSFTSPAPTASFTQNIAACWHRYAMSAPVRP